MTVGRIGAFSTLFFVLVALYAPFLRSHLPLIMMYDGVLYFPLLDSLLSPLDFPSLLERCWNMAAIVLPVALLTWLVLRRVWCVFVISVSLLLFMNYFQSQNTERRKVISYVRDVLYDAQIRTQIGNKMDQEAIRTPRKRHLEQIQQSQDALLQKEAQKVSFIVFPPFGLMSWSEDIGGSLQQNNNVSLEFMTRRTRQDLLSGLLFGLRVSLFVGSATFLLSILLAVPLGLISGYFGGWFDLFLCRVVEVWESLPQFLTLLLIITFFETKTIFLVVILLALFGWTTLFRYIRAEVLRERKQPYVECLELYGINRFRILFRHLLPNTIYPVLALAPFEVMGAITRESALSFLGLGDEKICSLGILMDEGRISFPQEGVLLWPPAILLTLLLIAIAFLGEGVRRRWNVKLQR